MNRDDFFLNLDVSSISCKLKELPKIELIRVDRTPQEDLWNYLVSEYHYLGFKKMFGRRIKYLIKAGDRIVAAISFNQATKKIKARDSFIGWTKEQREENLDVIANNNRFLIMPWIKVKFLASHVLSLAIRQVVKDWKEQYGVRLLLLETFVDHNKYRGTSYLAANWKYVGNSSGYSKLRDGSYTYHGNLKGVYLYSLKKDFRKILGCEVKPNHSASRMRKCEEELKMLAHQNTWEPDILEKIGIIPEQVNQLSEKLYEYYRSYESCFNHVNQFPLGLVYLMGLMSTLERKSIEPMALEYLNANGVRALQSFITDSPWDDKKMGTLCRENISKRINDSDGGMITFDGSDFLKKGKNSAGVMRQYCGVVGATNNCQAGIFMGYSGRRGYGLIENQLYIPEKWFGEDFEILRKKCKFPAHVEYKSKCNICLELLDKIRKEDDLQAKWIGIDSFFGSNGKFRDEISEMGYYYFADVRSSTCIWPTMPQMRPTKRKDKDGNTLKGWPVTEPISVKDFVMQDNSMWIETILGEGSKGPNRSHIKLFRVYENNNGLPGREVWLFVRRFSGGKLKFSFSNAPEDFTIEGLDKMAITRWTIEQGFKECKNELGMDHYEVRSYRGWHRHMLLVMVAHEFLCQVQNMFKKKQDLSSTDELASDPSCRIINEDASIPDNVKSIKEEIRPIENVIDLTKKAFGKGKQDLEVPHSVDENTVSPRDVSNKYANKAESSKIPNQEVNTCGVLHLSNYEIDKIREITIDTDLPIITLPMAKMLAASAFSEDMKNICRTINKIDFYLHRNWKAYKSHRKRKMLQIESRTPL